MYESNSEVERYVSSHTIAMKKAILILFIVIKAADAKCDVVFFPVQYSLLCYSAELIYSYEKARKLNSTTNYWGGIGVVGSFFYIEAPVYGLELAIERRRYFKPDQYRNFFISAYAGAAYMTNIRDISNLGIVPGIKMNYKVQLSQQLILEPYVGLSLPFTYDLKHNFIYVPFPVLTVGARFGLSKLVRRINP